MAPQTQLRYRAFLSYSHHDAKACERLHTALERYQVPSDLVARNGAHGPIPQNLCPIFRDRIDLEAGDSIPELVSKHIRASDAMIVICSPHAATSKHVNEEVRQFISLGRKNRIYPLIVAGKPGDPQLECFPPALRFEIDANGVITSNPTSPPLAGDARPHADGPAIADEKIIAGLLGVSLDTLRQREAKERKRKTYRKAALVGLLVMLSLGSVLSVGLSRAKSRLEVHLDRTTKIAFDFAQHMASLVETVGIRDDVAVQLLGQSKQALDDIKDFGNSLGIVGVNSDKLDHAVAMTALTVAKNYRWTGNRDGWWIGANDAHAIMQQQVTASNRSKDPEVVLGHLKALLEVARTYLDIDKTTEAKGYVDKALALVEEGFGAGGSAARFRLERSNVYEIVADLRQKNSRWSDALGLWQRAKDIRSELLEGDARNLDVKLALSTAHVGVGQALAAMGDGKGAIAHYQRAREIRQELVNSSPRTVRWQRLLSWAMSTEAEAIQSTKPEEARAIRERVFEIRQKLAAENPGIDMLRRDLGWAHWSLAESLPLEKRDDRIEHAQIAARSFREVHQRLPDDMRTRRDLGRAEALLGSFLVELDGGADEGVSHLREANLHLGLAAEANPENPQLRFLFADTMSKLGRGYFMLGDCTASGSALATARQILMDLATATRQDKTAERALEIVERRANDLGNFRERGGCGNPLLLGADATETR